MEQKTEATVVALRKVSEPQPEVDEKMKAKLDQLAKARESKKRKRAAKDDEDRQIREKVKRLEAENSDLKNKPEPEGPAPSPPVVVTSRRAPPEPESDDDDDDAPPPFMRSFSQQAAVTGIVAGLGLASWVVQNKLWQNTAAPSKPKVPVVPQKKTPASSVPPKTTRPAPSSLLFGAQKPKKTVGRSGFTL